MPSSLLLFSRGPTRSLHPTTTSAFHGRDQWTAWTAASEADASSLSGSTSLHRTANGGVASLSLPGGRISEWLLIIFSAVGAQSKLFDHAADFLLGPLFRLHSLMTWPDPDFLAVLLQVFATTPGTRVLSLQG